MVKTDDRGEGVIGMLRGVIGTRGRDSFIS